MSVTVSESPVDGRDVRDELERTQVELGRARAEVVRSRDELAQANERHAAELAQAGERLASELARLEEALAGQERLRQELHVARHARKVTQEPTTRAGRVRRLLGSKVWLFWLALTALGLGALGWSFLAEGRGNQPVAPPPPYVFKPRHP